MKNMPELTKDMLIRLKMNRDRGYWEVGFKDEGKFRFFEIHEVAGQEEADINSIDLHEIHNVHFDIKKDDIKEIYERKGVFDNLEMRQFIFDVYRGKVKPIWTSKDDKKDIKDLDQNSLKEISEIFTDHSAWHFGTEFKVSDPPESGCPKAFDKWIKDIDTTLEKDHPTGFWDKLIKNTCSISEFRMIMSPTTGDIYNVIGLGKMLWDGNEWQQVERGPNDAIWANDKNKVEQEVNFSYKGSAFPSENNITVGPAQDHHEFKWFNPQEAEFEKMTIQSFVPDKAFHLDRQDKTLHPDAQEKVVHPDVQEKTEHPDSLISQKGDDCKDDDKLFVQLKESLMHNVRKEFVDNFEEYVKDLYHDWKEEILKHDAFLVRNDRLITVDIVDPDDNDHVILLFYRGKKRIASFVESLSWFPGNESKAEEFEVWQKQAFMQDPHAKYIRLQSMIDWYFDSSQLNMYYNH